MKKNAVQLDQKTMQWEESAKKIMKHSERLGAIDRTSGDNIELRIRNTAKDTMRFRFVFCFVCLFFFVFFLAGTLRTWGMRRNLGPMIRDLNRCNRQDEWRVGYYCYYYSVLLFLRPWHSSATNRTSTFGLVKLSADPERLRRTRRAFFFVLFPRHEEVALLRTLLFCFVFLGGGEGGGGRDPLGRSLPSPIRAGYDIFSGSFRFCCRSTTAVAALFFDVAAKIEASSRRKQKLDFLGLNSKQYSDAIRGTSKKKAPQPIRSDCFDESAIIPWRSKKKLSSRKPLQWMAVHMRRTSSESIKMSMALYCSIGSMSTIRSQREQKIMTTFHTNSVNLPFNRRKDRLLDWAICPLRLSFFFSFEKIAISYKIAMVEHGEGKRIMISYCPRPLYPDRNSISGPKKLFLKRRFLWEKKPAGSRTKKKRMKA